MLRQISKYTDDAAGIEKLLRFLQGICLVQTGLALSKDDAAPWEQARSQFALGRRYFRFMKWYPCWNQAYQSFQTETQSTVRMVLAVSKWSFLGMYFFLEASTITNAMKVTAFEWGPTVQVEALKFWFYCISISIVLTLYDLFVGPGPAITQEAGKSSSSSASEKSPANKKEKRTSKDKVSTIPVPKTVLVEQLFIDICDITIPGSTVGWLPLDSIVVGAASSLSSVLAGRHIWIRAQHS